MKHKVLYFYMGFDACLCRQANNWMEELVREHPEYGSVEIRKG